MSKKRTRMLNAAINTDSFMFCESSRDLMVNTSRLKERVIKHVRIVNSAELHEVYKFGELIGQGSFGKVVSVRDKETDQEWAMKIVNKNEIGDKLYVVQRELMILKMVDHPHIIYLDKVYESSKALYLLLERCYGELWTLFQEKRKFLESETKKVIGDLADAVAYLHKNDIVHRDLKMENILIAKNPNDSNDDLYVKISDFSLGIIKQGSGYKDMLHEYCGTIMYMAPEIITNHSYSQQCDVWAMGVLLYMLLGGRFPFYSNAEKELVAKICEEEPSYHGFSASKEALHLTKRMLCKNPALRITAAEVLLHPWLKTDQVGRRSSSPDNVLDMMRLWRSKTKLTVVNEREQNRSGRMAVGSVTGRPATRNFVAENARKTTNGSGASPRGISRQSLRLPAKNIFFQKQREDSVTLTPGVRRQSNKSAAVGSRGTINNHNTQSHRSLSKENASNQTGSE